jgi:hypothetical protein
MAPVVLGARCTNISSIETMKLQVSILKSTIVALVDYGSMHSFISSEAACRLHLEPLHRPGLYVTVANGDRVASASICCDMHCTIDSEEFILDFFVIPLTGYDMVLGVH